MFLKDIIQTQPQTQVIETLKHTLLLSDMSAKQIFVYLFMHFPMLA